jgi:septal ring factor EnvC (AmiA/AmiB activator)
MTKVLFLLSAVIMVVAGFFAYQNRQTFVDARIKRHETDVSIKKQIAKLDGFGNEILKIKADVSKITTEVSNESERLDQVKIKLRNSQSEVDNNTQQIAQKNDRLKQLKADLTDLPPGVTVETLTEHMNQLKTTIAQNEAQVGDAKKATETKQAEVKKVQDQLEDIQKRINDHKKAFDRNSMTATIVAVNNDWGFVVIDGGQNKGITSDTKLLITRGTTTVGKLNIVAVEGTKTVANIVQDSLRSGLAVAPGDKVILESLYQ